MSQILGIIEKYSGGKCYYSDRYTLDHYTIPEYEDKDEIFNKKKIFETDNHLGKTTQLHPEDTEYSLFCYFLDGSRRTYKIVDFATDNKLLPIIAGQIGTAVTIRKNKKLKTYKISKINVIAVPDRLGGEFDTIQKEIQELTTHKIKIDKLLKYQYKHNPDRPFENLAIAKVQFEMLNMEIELVDEMVRSQILKTDKMLVIDGSLQHSGINENNEYIFENVIGISKSFNPHLVDLLKTRGKEIGHYLTSLNYGERTPVFVYERDNKRVSTKIGAWYIRIRTTDYSKDPLAGVIKIEKIATTPQEKEDGFETSLIDEISRAILRERNVTSYGKDNRWANHIYPIYLTEELLKNSFLSDLFFLNIF